jgi:GcrA cell cycle regulator
MKWTPEMQRILAEQWTAGILSRDIAKAMNERFGINLSRDSITGRAHRTHLGPHPERTRSETPPERYSTPEDRVKSCQWPIGDPGAPDFHFCGDGAVIGKPYCVKHCDVAYKPRKDGDD